MHDGFLAYGDKKNSSPFLQKKASKNPKRSVVKKLANNKRKTKQVQPGENFFGYTVAEISETKILLKSGKKKLEKFIYDKKKYALSLLPGKQNKEEYPQKTIHEHSVLIIKEHHLVPEK